MIQKSSLKIRNRQVCALKIRIRLLRADDKQAAGVLADHSRGLTRKLVSEYSTPRCNRLIAVDLAERRVVARRSDPQPDWRLFQQLDAMTRPGLTQVQFRSLFTVCGVCGLVTTRQVFSFHQCRDRQSRARTDLTDVE